MFGLPGETPRTVKKTIDFSKELDTDYAYFFTATPLPGTEYFEIARRQGWLISQDWNRYRQGGANVISFDTLSGDEILQAVAQGYLSFYLRPARMIKECREIRSIKDIFRYIYIGCKLFTGTF
jgi:radical SAM superfamily enzyme YgiQ (UPF0313 family)